MSEGGSEGGREEGEREADGEVGLEWKGAVQTEGGRCTAGLKDIDELAQI